MIKKHFLGVNMKWLKFETQEEEEASDPENSYTLVYLGPEALKHAVIVDDFGTFQDSPECVPGGRLLEVGRQYSYRLRQVADLVEEPMEEQKFNLKAQSKRNFQAEIRPEKHLENKKDDLMIGSPNTSNQEHTLDDAGDREKSDEPQQNVKPEQVPFKDLESLFVK